MEVYFSEVIIAIQITIYYLFLLGDWLAWSPVIIPSTEWSMLSPIGPSAVWRHIPSKGWVWPPLPLLPFHTVHLPANVSATRKGRHSRQSQPFWHGGDDQVEWCTTRHWGHTSTHRGNTVSRQGKVSLKLIIFKKFLSKLRNRLVENVDGWRILQIN